jgi:hypothetical protein
MSKSPRQDTAASSQALPVCRPQETRFVSWETHDIPIWRWVKTLVPL